MFFVAIITFKAFFGLCLAKFPLSNKKFESMLSKFKTKLYFFFSIRVNAFFKELRILFLLITLN